jgi:glycosyltransferase involved in cell wall biosynthesis
MALGKPAISIGTYNGFIRNRETGVLLSQYRPRELADAIVWLSQNPTITREMGERAQKLVQEVCSIPVAAKRLTDVWVN